MNRRAFLTGRGLAPRGARAGAGGAGSRARLSFPNVELSTHEGRRVRFFDDLLKGKVVTINFMYTECGGI